MTTHNQDSKTKSVSNKTNTTEINCTAKEIENTLQFLGNEEKAKHLMRFFKTGKGQYGEGDLFLGIVVPESRKVAKAYQATPIDEIKKLIQSPFHECRLVALMILIEQYKKASDAYREEIVQFYLAHTIYINNWDLVDLSADKILGAYLKERNRDLLYQLAKSSLLWEQRISIVTTLAFVRKGDLDDALQLARALVYHEHDLMRKAVGWVLREVGKKDRERLCLFLAEFAATMPRTALRYAIEHFDESKRQYYMNLAKQK